MMYPLPLPVALAFWLISLFSSALALPTRTSNSPRDGGKPSSQFVTVSASGTGFAAHGK